MSKICNELTKATGLSPKEGEDQAKFRARLCRAVSELPDDKWAAVSAPAQKWVNDAIEELNVKKPVPEFPDAAAPAPAPKRAAVVTADDEEDDAESAPKAKPKSDDDEDDEPEVATPAPKAKPKADAPKADAPKAKQKSDDDEDDDAPAPAPKPKAETPAPAPTPAPKAKKEADETETSAAKPKKGAGRAYRRAMLENPKKTMAELHADVVASGFEISTNTAYITFYETKQTLEVLAGLSDEKILAAVHAFRKAD